MSQTPELVAVVNSFNRRDLLQAALHSLVAAFQKMPLPTAVVVFEAGSNDGSAEWLEQYQTEHPAVLITVIRPGPDGLASIAAGINRGCHFALAQYPSAQWLFLYETDNLLHDPVPLLQAIEILTTTPELAAVGFTVRKLDGRPAGFGSTFPRVRHFALGPQLCDILGWGGSSAPAAASASKWFYCDVVYTSPLLIRRVAWEQSQGFDALEFPYADCDVDWAWRLHARGWRLAVLRTEAVIHDNREQLSAWSAQRTLAFHRARLKLLRRHRGPAAHWIKPVLFARHLVEFAAVLLLARRLRHPAGSAAQRWKMLRRVWHGYA